MNKEELNKARNIIEELFFDEKHITQWQYELLTEAINIAGIKVKNNCDLAHVSGSFNHDIIEKIRKSQSDAEARRKIAEHFRNYR